MSEETRILIAAQPHQSGFVLQLKIAHPYRLSF